MAMIPKRNSAAAAAPAAAPAAAKPTLRGTVAPPAAETGEAPVGEAAAPAATTALAAAPSRAVAVAGPIVNVIKETYKDAMRVEWNTLGRIQANQGQFLDLENNKASLGGEIRIELMSYQDNWQISPGTDDKDDTQHVRYSDDGITTNQGEPCKEYVAALHEAGYTDAKMGQRVTLAGVVVDCPANPGFAGTLFQIDLSPTSKAQFDRFSMQVALSLSRGLVGPEQTQTIKMKTSLQSKGSNTWTIVTFAPGGPLAA